MMRLFSLAALFLISSCSVKEIRDNCPCYTVVNIDEFIEAGFKEAMFSYTSDKLIMRNFVELSPYEGSGFEQAMPRRKARNAVIAGMKHCQIRGDSLSVPYGFEFDPIWISGNVFYCEDDDYHFTALPKKQYCNMTFIVKDMSEGGEMSFDYRVKADCNAIDIYSLRALDGDYCALAKETAFGAYSLRIPRQKDGNISLEICRIPYDSAMAVEVLSVFDLGNQLLQKGYDWESENLKDVSVIVDFANSEIRLNILDWDEDPEYNDTII